MPTAAYTLEVDWTNAGVWVDETANLLSATVDRGFASPLARMSKAGRGTFVLSNRAKAYSPPLVANALPRRPVRFSMTVSGTPGYLFRGFIDRISPSSGLWDSRAVTLDCVDAVALMDLHEGPIALMTNARADEVVSAVVAAVYTPPATSYDRGISVFPVAADKWAFAEWGGFDAAIRQEQIQASRKIQDVCTSDWGRFYVSKSGSPAFANRHSLALNATTAFTVSDDAVSLNYSKDAGEVFNQVEVTFTPRALGSTAEVLGRVDRPVKLEASASQTVTVRFADAATKDTVGGASVITPLSGTDYSATNDEAGEGSSASVSALMTAYADRAEITLTNGTAAPAWVRGAAGGATGLQVRGYAVRSRQAVTMTAADATSITAYQKRKLSIRAPLMATESDAQRLADYLLALTKTPANKVRGVTLWANRDATSLAYARDAELLQRIVVTEAQTGLSSYAGYVFALRHTITGLAEHTLTLDLETAPSVGTPFRLDTSALNSGHVLIY